MSPPIGSGDILVFPMHPSVCPSISGCLLQNPKVLARSFETLQMFLSRSEDVHDVLLYPQINFCHFFRSSKSFWGLNIDTLGILWTQLLLQI